MHTTISREKDMHCPDVASFIERLLRAATVYDRPVALWRLPAGKSLHFVSDLSQPEETFEAGVEPDLEALGSGFVVAPFLLDEGRKPFFIKADFHLSWSVAAPFAKAPLLQKLQDFEEALHSHFASRPRPDRAGKCTPVSAFASATQFKAAVEKAREAVARGEMQKVVLSRVRTVPLPEHFSLVKSFMRLLELYPHAFVSLIVLPQAGIWMGASPETLISIDRHRIFRTMSLAGTQSGEGLESLHKATWTQKEIEEQALVSRYIINCFKKIRLREFDEIGPRTVAAGHLIHLRTDFEVNLSEVNFPELGTVMLQLLHPTSAVCGMPKEDAVRFIAGHEGYDRELYSGYLGPVNVEEESHIFVNLRCMQIKSGHALIYAGAGITRDSDPDREWNETEIKGNIIRKVLE